MTSPTWLFALQFVGFGFGFDEPATPPPPAPAFVTVEIVEFEPTPAELTAMLDELRTALASECGILVPEAVTVRVAKREEIEEALTKEFSAQFVAIAAAEAAAGRDDSSELEARRVAASLAQATSLGVLGKYEFATQTILICEENLEELQEIAAMPSVLATRDGVRALLIHECVHAADHALNHLDDLIAGARSHDELRALNALSEGHAQFVTRKAVAKLGGVEPFEAFTSWIGKKIEGESVAETLIAQVAQATLASAYLDGERFVTALYDAGGNEAIARAFKEPPKEAILIDFPEWYLDPASRPSTTIDLDASIESAVKRYAEDQYAEQRLRPGSAEIRAAVSMHPDQEFVTSLLKKLTSCRIVTMSPQQEVEDGFVYCSVFEFASAEDATAFETLELELSAIKDEKMTEGPIRIVSSNTEAMVRDSERFTLVRKRMENNGTEIPICLILGRRGSLVIEITIVGRVAVDDELGELAVNALDAAFGVPAKK